MTDKKTFLTKDQILKIQDKKIEEIEVPQWGGVVRVRSLSLNEIHEVYDFITSQKGEVPKDFKARIVSMCVCDSEGRRIFGDEDIKALAERDAKSVNLVFEVAQRLTVIGEKKINDPGEKIFTDSELKS